MGGAVLERTLQLQYDIAGATLDFHNGLLGLANCGAASQLEGVEGFGVVVNYLAYRRIWDLSAVGRLL
jgi:hypothetical protein